MRTARRVIVSILLAACCGVQAQDAGVSSAAVDQTLTIVGRDETVIPVPPPVPVPISLPEIDDSWMAPPDLAPVLPAVTPPRAMSPFPLAVPDPRDVLRDARTP